MLDDLNELKTFRAILAEGSLSGAARRLGVTLAVVSKRLKTLEGRTGTRLVQRTTRSLSPTEEGVSLLGEVTRALEAIESAEEQLVAGGDEPAGTLRVSASVAFGRRFVAPVLGTLALRHRRLSVELSVDDHVVDLVAAGIDVAIRVGGLSDSSAMVRKLADNRRILVASPSYLDRAGRPKTPEDASAHTFLRWSTARNHLRLHGPGGATAALPAAARFRGDDGDVIRAWGLMGCGIMLRSVVDVSDDLAAGRLERVLPDWDAGDAPICALYPRSRHVPRRTRAFLDEIARSFAAIEAASPAAPRGRRRSPR